MSDVYDIPKDKYPFAEKVPRGGSSCASCKYVRGDGLTECANKRYIAEHGSNELGAPADEFCCMVWTPKGGRKEDD